jgi:hypothetical protein
MCSRGPDGRALFGFQCGFTARAGRTREADMETVLTAVAAHLATMLAEAPVNWVVQPIFGG